MPLHSSSSTKTSVSTSVLHSVQMIMKSGVAFLGVALIVRITTAEELHTFKKIQLSDQFWCEGANFGDLNNDGVNDLISGPWWWEGPDYQKRHEIYAPKTT